jgi:ParB family chromosome partitioning protein
VNAKAERRALGRGLDALLPPPKGSAPAGFADKSVFSCPLELVVPQKGQPRQHFDDAELEELTASIREHGVLEPLVVRKVGGATERYELIAGERRWRAAQRAGLREVLVVVKDVSPKAAFELALVENLQRADLNPIEVAESFDRLLREHGYTQETIAKRVGKDRTTVTNALRLLRLPARVRTLVVSRELSEGHARALLGAPDEAALERIADQVVRGRLPVRKVEELIRQAKKGPAPKAKGSAPKRPAGLRDLEVRLERKLGAKCEVRDQGGKGELAIRWGSLDDLDRILRTIGVSQG